MGFRVISFVALLVASVPAWADDEPMVWKVDWNNFETIDLENFEPFSSPGVIAGDYTFDGTMDVIGRAWEASSPQEVIGLLCVNYGPLVYALTGENGLRDTCDHIVPSLKWGTTSDVTASCVAEWIHLGFGNDENNTLFTLVECYTFAYESDTGIPIAIQYAGDIIAGVYSSCPGGYGLGTDRLSTLASGALDWLGPSVLYAATGDRYTTPYGACSLLRYMLSMEVDEIMAEVTTLMSHPIADALEYLQYLQICSKLGGNVDHSEGFNLILDLLLSFSGRTSTSMCTFLEATNTRDTYMEEATKVADSMMSIMTDATLCQDIMAEIATLDGAIPILETVTGENLGNVAGRNALCVDIAVAFTTGSSSTLDSYSLPNGVDINAYVFLSTAGELLPNFYFADALDFAGAVYTSNTVTDAIVVYCDVFENFLVDNEVFYGVDVAELCDFFRNDDLADIENFCLEQTVSTYDESYPLSLRKFDPMMVGGDMARRLIGIEKFSRDDLCSTIDTFVNSNHNLRSIVSFALSAYLREGLPSANGICQDWGDAICYLGPYCGGVSNYERTEQANYMDKVNTIEDLILLALGYSTRTALCNDISSGIDTLSGRANDEVVEDMKSKILFVWENSARCTEVADAVLEFISSEMETDGGEVNPGYYMYMVTGRNTTADICDVVASTFPSYGLPRAQTSLLVIIISLLAAIFTRH